ncbi:MAG: DUF92 domain-containing protein [Bacteroidota bacterium]
MQFIVATLLAAAVALISRYFRFLTLSGAIATFFLAAVIFGLGGWQWSIPIVTFFVSSSLLSKFGKKRKAQFELMFEKTDARDAGQVAANGGIAGIVMLCSYFFPAYHQWYFLYVASLAAVTADTWGTEIGLLAKSSPRSIISLKKVEAGTSGAVTPAGIVGGACGALFITSSGIFWITARTVVLAFTMIIFSGMFGAFLDSLLGATVQAKYRCGVCGKITERKLHCESPTTLVGGVRWIDNDIVNWACPLGGALFFVLMTS